MAIEQHPRGNKARRAVAKGKRKRDKKRLLVKHVILGKTVPVGSV
jgi:hypothetical protein